MIEKIKENIKLNHKNIIEKIKYKLYYTLH
jgi:hypothetical protein